MVCLRAMLVWARAPTAAGMMLNQDGSRHERVDGQPALDVKPQRRVDPTATSTAAIRNVRTSLLMMLSPDVARAVAMPINPCTGAPGATPHWTCIGANPPGHASPPGTQWHRGPKVARGRLARPASLPIRPAANT